MNRKSMMVVLREVFAFTFGVLVLVTVTSMFNTTMIPEIKKFSYNEQLQGIISQINSMIVRVDYQMRSGVNSTFTIIGGMPSRIDRNSYRVFVDGNRLCARSTGDVVMTRCLNYSTNSVLTGNYLSGTEILIVGDNNPSIGAVITFENNL